MRYRMVIANICLFIGAFCALFTGELVQEGHILSPWGRMVDRCKDDGLLWWVLWKYTTCHICLSMLIGLISAVAYFVLTMDVIGAVQIPVYSAVSAQSLRKFIF